MKQKSNSNPSKLQARAIKAANDVMQRDGAVGPIEFLVRMGFLEQVHVDQWKRGSPHFRVLEDSIQCGEKKLADSFRFFSQWVASEGLESSEAIYQSAGRSGARQLQVLADEDVQRNRFFHTRYHRADLSPARKKQVQTKLNKKPDLVVFVLTSEEATCADCGEMIYQGDWMFREEEQPLCLTCADFDHLEFLPSGNATLSRRAKKFSSLCAIVVRFNRRRKRYERQGILVTSSAITQAHDSMDADTEQRAKQREVAADRRVESDTKLVESITDQIRQQFSQCPLDVAQRIATHTAQRGSGRVGRSAAGRNVDPDAIKLAVIAHVRHEHTDYDELLMNGVERREARRQIQQSVQAKLRSWQ